MKLPTFPGVDKFRFCDEKYRSPENDKLFRRTVSSSSMSTSTKTISSCHTCLSGLALTSNMKHLYTRKPSLPVSNSSLLTRLLQDSHEDDTFGQSYTNLASSILVYCPDCDSLYNFVQLYPSSSPCPAQVTSNNET